MMNKYSILVAGLVMSVGVAGIAAAGNLQDLGPEIVTMNSINDTAGFDLCKGNPSIQVKLYAKSTDKTPCFVHDSVNDHSTIIDHTSGNCPTIAKMTFQVIPDATVGKCYAGQAPVEVDLPQAGKQPYAINVTEKTPPAISGGDVNSGTIAAAGAPHAS